LACYFIVLLLLFGPQAYKTHHLYVLERWLNKYETLHPKGPVLGFCAGLPVYPRTCVQTLHTPDRWLREGRKVKQGETPVKVGAFTI
jgi:xeroderma pigmentosum group C-complementing protein